MGGRQTSALERMALAALLLAGGSVPVVAVAQGLVVQPAVPQGFDRDRNVSVMARSRPSYTPIGISVGGLLFFPSVETGAGVTTNAYLTETNNIAAAFASVTPSVRVRSIWSRHSLSVNGSTSLRNYIGEQRRNERTWNLGSRGEVELGRAFRLSAEVDASQQIENLFSGEVISTVAALSRFRRDFAAVRGEYKMGRVRVFSVVDYADFAFRPVPLSDGSFRDQQGRDRTVKRIISQFEYARTPSVSLFAQVGYADTTFDRGPIASARLDSTAVRALGGINVDLAGRARGTIGVGYSVRDYRAAGFTTVKGLVAEGRIELFPSELFTITTGARRSVEDTTANIVTPQPFWDNRLSLRGDYELRNNLIVSAQGEYALQSYINRDQQNSTYRGSTSARYLVSRRLTLDGSVSYSKRASSGADQRTEPGEGRVEAGLTFHI